MMNQSKIQMLLKNLADERSRRVVFVSHCLLNENTRYLGGAFRPGCVDEIVDEFQREGIGICQMRCPEQRAWGGVLKRRTLPAYGSRGTLLYRVRRLYVPLFVWYTRFIYGRLAAEVVRDIEDYVRSGFEVVGVVGLAGSPSCGVTTTLDPWRWIEVLAGWDIENLDRQAVNEQAIAACLTPGEGFFMEAIRRRLRQKGLDVRFYEHDLMAEMRGESTRLSSTQGGEP